jgi:hypothetical protein
MDEIAIWNRPLGEAEVQALWNGGTGRGLIPYVIHPGHGAHGTIHPSTAQTNWQGGRIVFTATPAAHYLVDRWFRNNTLVQRGGTTWTLLNIHAGGSVYVTFRRAVVDAVTASAGPGGAVSPAGLVHVEEGVSRSFRATPGKMFLFERWERDGQVVQRGGTTYVYRATAGGNHTLRATFKHKPQPPWNDFNHDGVSELTVFDWAKWQWFIQAIDGAVLAYGLAWGGEGMMPVPGDYNGDGYADLAAFDPATGKWYIRTLGGTRLLMGAAWGRGMIPVPGDYNGDGKWDLAVFDQSTARWYIRSVGGTLIAFELKWGEPGWIPVSGDYDGDGKWDLATYDAATGRWYIRSVAGALIAFGVQWGGPDLIPVPGDYDGDGLSDLAVYQESTGRWYIRNLFNEPPIAFGVQWGGPGMQAVPGDYNGDGKADLAVYERRTGNWFIRTVSGTPLVMGKHWGGPALNPSGAVGLTIVTPVANPGVVGEPYGFQLRGAGGRPPYLFGTLGGLPPGIGLGASGVLSGVPTMAGTFRFQVIMNDQNGKSTQREVMLRVYPDPWSGKWSGTYSYAGPGSIPCDFSSSGMMTMNLTVNPYSRTASGPGYQSSIQYRRDDNCAVCGYTVMHGTVYLYYNGHVAQGSFGGSINDPSSCPNPGSAYRSYSLSDVVVSGRVMTGNMQVYEEVGSFTLHRE